MKRRAFPGVAWLTIAFGLTLSLFFVAKAPAEADPPVPPPLSTVTVPEPANLGDFVVDRTKAIILGKALFWDMQIGSDGVQACASCHFHAGADSRARNQLSPGLNNRNSDGTPNPDRVATRGFNYTLTADDFPFRLLADPNDRNSAVLRDTNDQVSSQGVKYRKFIAVTPGVAIDVTQFADDPDGFKVGGLNVRRVVPRHAPSVINAVFNHRQFWDGRAQNEFNGANPFGSRDPYAGVYRADTPSLSPVRVQVAIANASLASQAVGPPVSSFEMSADGRTFIDIGDKFMRPMRDSGKKMKQLRPLGQQIVHPQDSVLGPYSRSPNPGLTFAGYSELIRAAFASRWWNSQWQMVVNADGSRTWCNPCMPGSTSYTLEEANFSLFFGLAIQLYESTLVSDQTPFDAYAGGDNQAISASARRGVDLFRSQARGRCINCHGGPELTNDAVRIINVTRFRRRNGNYLDQGFNNIGVRPTSEDLLVGGTDPFGRSLSEARLVFQGQFSNPQPPPVAGDTVGTDGAVKVPSLRNIELTAPYFHNGGTLTLRQVIDFYSRGGDFVPITGMDGTSISPLATLNLSENEKDDLLAFLMSLTDERVRYQRAPFDHPSLTIPNGHPGDANQTTPESTLEPNQAADLFRTIDAVGSTGGAPLPLFPVP